ncbi:MAG: hypothetical protein KBD31_05220 [Proteobacteria bacterium]|nr:hypothetical protein [Pseudomonadota bacterium]
MMQFFRIGIFYVLLQNLTLCNADGAFLEKGEVLFHNASENFLKNMKGLDSVLLFSSLFGRDEMLIQEALQDAEESAKSCNLAKLNKSIFFIRKAFEQDAKKASEQLSLSLLTKGLILTYQVKGRDISTLLETSKLYREAFEFGNRDAKGHLLNSLKAISELYGKNLEMYRLSFITTVEERIRLGDFVDIKTLEQLKEMRRL